MRLLRKTPLSFTRATQADDYDENGFAVTTESTTTVDAVGSLQRWNKGTSRIPLPEGVKATETLVYITETPLQGEDDYGHFAADKTTIKGIDYVAKSVMDSSHHDNLRVAHYKALLTRLPKNA